MSPKNKCKDCKFMTKQKGSMPKNRVCEVNSIDIFVLEVNPEAMACESFERKKLLEQTHKTQEKINNAQ